MVLDRFVSELESSGFTRGASRVDGLDFQKEYSRDTVAIRLTYDRLAASIEFSSPQLLPEWFDFVDIWPLIESIQIGDLLFPLEQEVELIQTHMDAIDTVLQEPAVRRRLALNIEDRLRQAFGDDVFEDRAH